MDGTSRDKKDTPHRSDDAPPDPVVVPSVVRTQLLELSARVLGAWEPSSVPVPLRRVRTFAPRRRAVSGAVPLWQALETSASFRHAVAAAWSAAHPREARALRPDGVTSTGGDVATASVAPGADESTEVAPEAAGGTGPAGAPGTPDDSLDEVTTSAGEVPVRDEGSAVGQGEAETERAASGLVDLAVGAFLLRPDGWEDHLARAASALETQAEAQHRAQEAERAAGERDRAVAELAAAQEAAAADRAALDEARAEIATLKKQERKLRSDADRARAEARAALAEAAARTEAAEALAARAADERREASVALDRAHAARDEARTLTHTGAELANARARLLLETVVDAAVGLRRELGIPPTTLRPADTVAPADGGSVPGAPDRTRPGSRGRNGDDPALLDDVLAVPQMHLIVDGYNVTKTGFGALTLAQQRRRLVDGLVRVASRTGAEVTCCFDGQDLGHLPPASTRGVRVLFTSGEIADHLIRRLVAAEPEGRPVAVVTSDREVADDVQAMGAVAIGSPALVARLARL
jgi:predicted RNA-binding protein with PIN domain